MALPTPIEVAVISGLLALLGGFAGAALTRRTEYEKWLRQERSTVYSDFLKSVHKATAEAVDVIYSHNGSELERDIKIGEIFQSLMALHSVVRLYLNPKDRDGFTEQIKLLAGAYSLHTNQSKRLTLSQNTLAHIQEVFERTIPARSE